MSLLHFRIDWGYQILYSRRHYHADYVWDGHIDCQGGKIMQVWKLHYPVLIGGIPHSPVWTEISGNSWQDSTRRNLSGIFVEADVEEKAGFTLYTASGIFHFTARQIIEDGHLVFPVGPKYSQCTVIVTREHYLWFRPAPQSGQQVFEYTDFPGLEQVNRNRMDCARLEAGQSVELHLDLPAPAPGTGDQTLMHLQAMAIGFPEDALPVPEESIVGGPQEFDKDSEVSIDGNFTLELSREDGTLLTSVTHYFRWHGFWCQLLEDVWAEFSLPAGPCTVRLKNCHPRLPLLLSRAIFQRQPREHLRLTLPNWLLRDEPFTGRVYARKAETATVTIGNEKPFTIDLQPGWNDFPLLARTSGPDFPVTVTTPTASASGKIALVYDLAEEAIPVKVGADLTTVPHDDNGDMDFFFDYTWRTRMGNYLALRNFNPDPAIPAPSSLKRWGETARAKHLWLQYTKDFDCTDEWQEGKKDAGIINPEIEDTCYLRAPKESDGLELREAAGPWLHNAGPHESAGVVYALDPDDVSTNMQDATNRFLHDMRLIADSIRARGMSPGLGDATGAHHLLYEAGFDFLRAETMVPHTMLLCSLARGAVRAAGKPEWGVHIAMQHAKWPFIEQHHLGQYFLSLYQPWMMDATVIYEEDSLALMFKEERQCWDDRLTKGKRQMTREFFRFAKTHPRQGHSLPAIAVIEGRYAAPFNGFICGPEQDPHYSVWGKYGRKDPLWGHAQPEKVFQLLDVLMPGACTHPLRQDPMKRRFFFSGTPYGDFDRLPIFAPAANWNDHKLAVLWGWNTMLPEDHDRLLEFVRQGGTLLTGLAQFNISADRQILADVAKMPLWRDGDLAELAGLKVLGAGQEFSGRHQFLVSGFEHQPSLTRIPSNSPDEDGPCPLANLKLCGAEPIVVDAASGQPLVTRFRLGQGTVWCLTTYAFAGHEKLSAVASALLAGLAAQNQPDCSLLDPSGEVFWTWRPIHGQLGQLMALNTDWTGFGQTRPVIVKTPACSFQTNVTSGRPLILTVLEDCVLEPLDASQPHLAIGENGSVLVTADHPEVTIRLHRRDSMEDLTFTVTPGVPTKF